MGKFIYMVSYVDCMGSGKVYQKFFTAQKTAKDYVQRMNIVMLKNAGYEELVEAGFLWNTSDKNNSLAQIYSSAQAAREFDWTNYWRLDIINSEYFVGDFSDNFDIAIST